MKVVIIGRPNVGKSSLFNAIFKQNIAIISNEEHTTRDMLEKKYIFDNSCCLEFVDTGGIESFAKPDPNDILLYKAYEKTYKAIQEASIILFVVDGSVPPTNEDKKLLDELRKINTHYTDIFLVINKVDNPLNSYAPLYLGLGIDNCFETSAKNGYGIQALLQTLKNYAVEIEDIKKNDLYIAVVGKPNVGKSSLINALINEKKLIVSEIPGTTRDSVDIEFILHDQKYIFIDTAGLVKKGKLEKNSIDMFSWEKTAMSIKRSDICILVIDASNDISRQDKRIADFILDSKKNCIIVVNKWDLATKKNKDINLQDKYIKYINKHFNKLKWAPIFFVSSYDRTGIEDIFDGIKYILENINQNIDEIRINKIIKSAFENRPHPNVKNSWCNFKKAHIISHKPLKIGIKVSDASILRKSYINYLINRLRENIDLTGISIILELYDHKKNKVIV